MVVHGRESPPPSSGRRMQHHHDPGDGTGAGGKDLVCYNSVVSSANGLHESGREVPMDPRVSAIYRSLVCRSTLPSAISLSCRRLHASGASLVG
jgi:hypothetical protein